MISNIEAVRNIATPSLAPASLVSTIMSVLHTSQIELGILDNFNRDWVNQCTFLMSCEVYILLTASDSLDKQVCIHWALCYINTGHTATLLYTWHRRWKQERCALHLGGTSLLNLCQYSVQRIRQQQCKCDLNLNSTSKVGEILRHSSRISSTSWGTLIQLQLSSSSTEDSMWLHSTGSQSLAQIKQGTMTLKDGSRPHTGWISID
jgi:hypothetical protein